MTVKLHTEFQNRDVISISVEPTDDLLNAAGLKWEFDADQKYLVKDPDSKNVNSGINDFLKIDGDKVEIRVEQQANGKYTFWPKDGLKDENGHKRPHANIEKDGQEAQAFFSLVSSARTEVKQAFEDLKNKKAETQAKIEALNSSAAKSANETKAAEFKPEYDYEHGAFGTKVEIKTDDKKALAELENSGLVQRYNEKEHAILVSVNAADQVVVRGESTILNERFDALSPEAKNLYVSTLNENKEQLAKEAGGFQENAHKQRLQDHHDKMMDIFLKEDVDAKAAGKTVNEYRAEKFEGKNEYVFERDKLNAQYDGIKEQASLIREEAEASKVAERGLDAKKIQTEIDMMPFNKMNDAGDIKLRNAAYMSSVYTTSNVQKDGSRTDGQATIIRVRSDENGNPHLIQPKGSGLAQRHDQEVFKSNFDLVASEANKRFERTEERAFNAAAKILDKKDISLSKSKDGLYQLDYAEGSLGGTKNTQLPGRTASNMSQANAFAQQMIDERQKAMRDVYSDSKFVVVSQEQMGRLDRNPFHLNKVVSAHSNTGEAMKVAKSTISNELMAKKADGRTFSVVAENSVQHFKAASLECQKKGINMYLLGEGNVAVNMQGSKDFFRAQSVTEASMIANRLDYARQMSMQQGQTAQQSNQAQQKQTSVAQNPQARSNVVPFKRHSNDFQVQPPSRIPGLVSEAHRRNLEIAKLHKPAPQEEKKHAYGR